jgi:hypothetical protein
MKINFNEELRTLEGESLVPVTTLKKCAVEALLANFPGEERLPGEEKAKRWLLATRIYANPENIELKPEDLVLIKKVVGMGYSPLIVGQAWELLDGKENLIKAKNNPEPIPIQ